MGALCSTCQEDGVATATTGSLTLDGELTTIKLSHKISDPTWRLTLIWPAKNLRGDVLDKHCGTVIEQIGSFVSIEPSVVGQPPSAALSTVFTFRGLEIKNRADLPNHAFITWPHPATAQAPLQVCTVSLTPFQWPHASPQLLLAPVKPSSELEPTIGLIPEPRELSDWVAGGDYFEWTRAGTLLFVCAQLGASHPSLQLLPVAHLLREMCNLQEEPQVIKPSQNSLSALGISQEDHAQLEAHIEEGRTIVVFTLKSAAVSSPESPDSAPRAEPINSHEISIRPDLIHVQASTLSGLFEAAATVYQLFGLGLSDSKQSLHNSLLPACRISDSARFGYRGLMIDSARHFIPVVQIEKVIKLMWLYKMNTLHWHLTDDEGWRLEIPEFPQLTQHGAWRGHGGGCLEPQLTTPPLERCGGYYTADDIRRVVQCAANHNVTVIPEIDLPGHCYAAIKALPELLFESEDLSEYRTPQQYTKNILNPGLPGTYVFLRSVIATVCSLFPGDRIHIGGDEVPKGAWAKSPAATAKMKEMGYGHLRELLGHLFCFIESEVQLHGKRVMTWEEGVGQGVHGWGGSLGLDQDTTALCWTDEEGAVAAAKLGHPVVLSPAAFLYLDIVQSVDPREPGLHWSAPKIDMRDIFEYSPMKVFDDADAGKAAEMVEGIQANLWSDAVPVEYMEYMLLPRLLAVSERAWCRQVGLPSQAAVEGSAPSWECFEGRVTGHLPMLQRLGYAYRPLLGIPEGSLL